MATKQHWFLKIRPAFLASFIKGLLRLERKLVETSHGKFWVDPFSNFGDELISQLNYEPGMTKILTSLLNEGDTFLDIGANEGYFSILGSHLVGKTGKVISIEPQTRLQNVIFRNMLENQSFNIHVFQRAISDKEDIVNLSLSPDMNTGSSGLLQLTKYRTKTQLVPQITLEDFLSLLNISKVKLMKINVEGFEYEVILGSRKLFEDNIIENIALELHPSILEIRNRKPSDILDFLKNCGYKENDIYPNLVMSKIF